MNKITIIIDAACDLYNNGEFVASLTPNNPFYLELPNAEYIFEFKGKEIIHFSYIYNIDSDEIIDIGIKWWRAKNKGLKFNGFGSRNHLYSIEIPEGKKRIADYAFNEYKQLTSVVIPRSVSEIGYEAFMDCTKLNYVEIPESVTLVKSGAFLNCHSLKQFSGDCPLISDDRKSLICINKGVLYPHFLEQIDSYTIPENVTKIAEFAFKDCKTLSSITIPDSVTKIGFMAFQNCTSLSYIKLPRKIKIIEMGTFMGCESLNNITIPDGVKTIDEKAFKDCSNLISIVIPKTVTRIESAWSANCKKLKDIYLTPLTPPVSGFAEKALAELSDDDFEDTYADDICLETIENSLEGRRYYVPIESIDKYKDVFENINRAFSSNFEIYIEFLLDDDDFRDEFNIDEKSCERWTSYEIIGHDYNAK